MKAYLIITRTYLSGLDCVKEEELHLHVHMDSISRGPTIYSMNNLKCELEFVS